VEVLAPAKVNLFLEVLARRPDGFHEIHTLLAPITVYDSIFFTPTTDGQIVLDCRWAHGLAAQDQGTQNQSQAARELLAADLPRGSQNLACRAAELLRARTGRSTGARICLIKRIPAAAGLGGASSDAAAVLLAANAAWQLQLPLSRLLAIAAELGSDVPFFLAGGAAIARGRGEELQPVRCPRLHVVVVKPPVGLATSRVYQSCQPAGPGGAARMVPLLAEGRAAQAAAFMVNHLQPAAERLTPWIERLTQEFERQPVHGHQMSGSGSSYFAICRTARQARRVRSALRARDVGWVMSATTEAGHQGH
jgi:4-diphosphocytidyl-2-C-methyl-D-erythritol kinase